jgi:hypothetical protein
LRALPGALQFPKISRSRDRSRRSRDPESIVRFLADFFLTLSPSHKGQPVPRRGGSSLTDNIEVFSDGLA